MAVNTRTRLGHSLNGELQPCRASPSDPFVLTSPHINAVTCHLAQGSNIVLAPGGELELLIVRLLAKTWQYLRPITGQSASSARCRPNARPYVRKSESPIRWYAIQASSSTWRRRLCRFP